MIDVKNMKVLTANANILKGMYHSEMTFKCISGDTKFSLRINYISLLNIEKQMKNGIDGNKQITLSYRENGKTKTKKIQKPENTEYVKLLKEYLLSIGKEKIIEIFLNDTKKSLNSKKIGDFLNIFKNGEDIFKKHELLGNNLDLFEDKLINIKNEDNTKLTEFYNFYEKSYLKSLKSFEDRKNNWMKYDPNETKKFNEKFINFEKNYLFFKKIMES